MSNLNLKTVANSFVQNDEQAITCPNRAWFGDYALHYCEKDKHICENPTDFVCEENE